MMTQSGGQNRDQVVQYMFGIRSMRQTIQEIKVNNATGGSLG